MLDGKKLLWFGLGLGACVGLIGCMVPGRSLDTLRGRGEPMAGGAEVPLVPVPPPPLGRAETAPDAVSPVSALTPLDASIPPPSPIRPAADRARPTAPDRPKSAPLAKAPTPRELYQAAQDRYARMGSYIARMRRREQVDGKLKPEEIITFKFRKAPWSVHLKWVGVEGKGREVVFVKGQYDGKLHTLLAAGDSFLFSAGKRMAFLPNNPLVLSASRHPITEAGIGASIDHLGDTLAAVERGDKSLGGLTLVRSVKRRSSISRFPAWCIVSRLASIPACRRAATRTYFFDPELAMPTLLVTVDARHSCRVLPLRPRADGESRRRRLQSGQAVGQACRFRSAGRTLTLPVNVTAARPVWQPGKAGPNSGLAFSRAECSTGERG